MIPLGDLVLGQVGETFLGDFRTLNIHTNTFYYTWLLSVSPSLADKRIIEQLRLRCLAQGHFGLQTAAEPLTFQLVDECHPSQMTESESVNLCQHEM